MTKLVRLGVLVLAASAVGRDANAAFGGGYAAVFAGEGRKAAGVRPGLGKYQRPAGEGFYGGFGRSKKIERPI